MQADKQAHKQGMSSYTLNHCTEQALSMQTTHLPLLYIKWRKTRQIRPKIGKLGKNVGIILVTLRKVLTVSEEFGLGSEPGLG